MSVQFGKWAFDGDPVDSHYLDRVAALLAPYGPDGETRYSEAGLNIIYRAFHTTMESHDERQPFVFSHGSVITWDGRLDNRQELLASLGQSTNPNCADVDIVSAAYQTWGSGCFARLIGDWAVAVWNPLSKTIVLATDPIGTRHLYYTLNADSFSWSSILDPLVLLANRTFTLCEEYLAGWFAGFPAADITPYDNVYAVPPSCSVIIHNGHKTVTKYWDFDPAKRIRYRRSEEYEEHFREVFREAIRRRLRANRPVLAELSGGIDSSAIVCMADRIIASGQAQGPRLDTISYFDESGSNLRENDFVAEVERIRERAGHHVYLNGEARGACIDSNTLLSWFSSRDFSPTLEGARNFRNVIARHYGPYLRSKDYRVTLSGCAGEHATGGFVPNPDPELQDLIREANIVRLMRQLRAWGEKTGKAPASLLWQAVLEFVSCSVICPGAVKTKPPSWLDFAFVQRNRFSLSWYPSRINFFGSLPSFQHNMQELAFERRSMAHRQLWPEMLREIRFPYLDREFLEFCYAVPREEIVGVGKRRFLMKRALKGIVPDDILDLKRKAVNQDASTLGFKPIAKVSDTCNGFISHRIGIIDENLIATTLHHPSDNDGFFALKRVLLLESWLRHLVAHRVWMPRLDSLDKSFLADNRIASLCKGPMS